MTAFCSSARSSMWMTLPPSPAAANARPVAEPNSCCGSFFASLG
eukprot:CAMPEP_0173112504 /NCGR_PEP_ID=MMETSP1102-20130122/46090_1 /TAXON_ID=49646 /ORGANISM="Geminigera sp., Strain Caron Lab Isolate" /LENGTH=43 /DNA_ID= /DNA_START= /DNA_END= /DNA_ORIENTATION=